MTDLDLLNHLGSAFHKRALSNYYKKNKKVLEKRIGRIKTRIKKNVLYKTKKYQKLALVAIHFKL